MIPRLALAASVVGALLIGSAVTGTTSASWVNQAGMSSSAVRAGTMGLGTPAAATTVTPALTQSATSSGTSTFSVTDSGTGKHLVQRVTATITGRPAGVAALIQVGDACAAGGAAAVFIDRRPADQSHTTTFCVRVTSSPTATTGNVTIAVTGQQQPTGWSNGPRLVTIPVPVTPTVQPPTITCSANQSDPNARTFTWSSAGAQATYQLYRRGPGETDFSTVGSATSVRTYTETALGNSQTSSFRIKTMQGTQPSEFSSTVTITRNGNSNNYNCSVTP